MQTTKPILTLSSLAGVETVDARYPPLEASTGRILSAWEQEEHRANPELVSRPPETQKKKRKGTGTTIMNKRSNTLASVSSRVDDLAQQIGAAGVTGIPNDDALTSTAGAAVTGYYVMPPPTPIVPVYVQAPAPSQWQEPPPSSQAHHDGFMWAQPPAQSHETATEHFQQLGDQRDTAPYKTSRQAGHKFVPYVPRPPPRRTDPSSQSQSQSQR
ncbi:hypothetical protein HRG_012735 [Hirsutella rhossiliensis]